MAESCEVAVIGAGPYGLSIAAHLAARSIPHRIFGKAMDTWATKMPRGMLLKSDGFATNVYDPQRQITFGRYCRERNIPYADLGIPPRLEDFIDYGRTFQRSLVPHLEEVKVDSVEHDGGRYRLQLETGTIFSARTVVVAAGISHFAVSPGVFSGLSEDLVTHASHHHDLGAFKGRKVAVIGAGASAADVAGLLLEAGAEAHLIVRGSVIPFQSKMSLPRPLYDQLRNPSTPIGPGWRSLFFTKHPQLFRHLPEERRLRIVGAHLGPAPGYFMRDRIIGRVPIHYGLQVSRAKPNAGGVLLMLANETGEEREFQADHVICGTGYKPALSRLPFLDHTMLPRIKAVRDTPILSANFEASMPGLYFVGAIAANTFGPMLRFACGAQFAASRLAKHLSRRHRRTAPGRAIGSRPPVQAIAPSGGRG